MARRPSQEVQELRARALARQRQAGKKVSRLRRVKGVEIGGTPLDPRKDRDDINRMNSIQLRAHLRRLDTFQSRDVQFVPDSEGRPIPGKKFKTYQRLIRQSNKEIRAMMKKIGDIYLESAGSTVMERFNKLKPKYRGLPDSQGAMPMERPLPESTSIASEKALDKLIRHTRKMISPEHKSKNIRKWQRNVVKGLRKMGDKDVLREFKKLSGAQQSFLITQTHFMNNFGMKYGTPLITDAGENTPEFYESFSAKSKDSMLRDIADASKYTGKAPLYG